MDYELERTIRETQLRAKEELSSFLQGYPWDAFVTATFKHRVSFPRQSMHWVWQRLWPSRRAFLAAEEHKLGGYHVHGLVEYFHNEPGDVYAHVLESRDQLEHLGWSRVEEVKAIGGCAGYCSKYLTKELGDYDFYGDWRGDADRTARLRKLVSEVELTIPIEPTS